MIRRRRSRLGTPQPDRDFPMGSRPMDLARNVPTYGLGSTLGAGPKPVLPVKPLNFNQLNNEYQSRLDKGFTGVNYLARHPRFEQRLANQNQAGPTGNKVQPNLPLSPEFEAAHRQLDDALSQALTGIGVQRDQIPALLAQLSARMDTDQQESLRQTDEAANARGIYNSGIRTQDRGKVNLGYDRQRQDVANTTAQQYAELAQAESGARSGYAKDLADLYQELARLTAQQDTLASPRPTRGKRRRRRTQDGRRR